MTNFETQSLEVTLLGYIIQAIAIIVAAAIGKSSFDRNTKMHENQNIRSADLVKYEMKINDHKNKLIEVLSQEFNKTRLEVQTISFKYLKPRDIGQQMTFEEIDERYSQVREELVKGANK